MSEFLVSDVHCSVLVKVPLRDGTASQRMGSVVISTGICICTLHVIWKGLSRDRQLYWFNRKSEAQGLPSEVNLWYWAAIKVVLIDETKHGAQRYEVS